jgi:hypothetical protein
MLGILPPGVEQRWDDCNLWAQASIMAWSNIRQTEIQKFEESKIKALAGAKGA